MCVCPLVASPYVYDRYPGRRTHTARSFRPTAELRCRHRQRLQSSAAAVTATVAAAVSLCSSLSLSLSLSLSPVRRLARLLPSSALPTLHCNLWQFRYTNKREKQNKNKCRSSMIPFVLPESLLLLLCIVCKLFSTMLS